MVLATLEYQREVAAEQSPSFAPGRPRSGERQVAAAPRRAGREWRRTRPRCRPESTRSPRAARPDGRPGRARALPDPDPARTLPRRSRSPRRSWHRQRAAPRRRQAGIYLGPHMCREFAGSGKKLWRDVHCRHPGAPRRAALRADQPVPVATSRMDWPGLAFSRWAACGERVGDGKADLVVSSATRAPHGGSGEMVRLDASVLPFACGACPGLSWTHAQLEHGGRSGANSPASVVSRSRAAWLESIAAAPWSAEP